MATLSLPVHSYRLRSRPASTARLVNCRAETLPPDAKTQLVLGRVEGVTLFSTAGNGPIRGMHAAFNNAWVVSGTTLYRITNSGSWLSIGTIPGNGPVSMAHNIDSVVVVSEPDAYYTTGVPVDGSDTVTIVTLTQITDADFTARGAKYVRFLDNYLLFMEPSSGRFFGADLGSSSSFDSLDFATAEGAPDDLTGMEVDHRQVLLLGEDTGEIWENTGAAGFPFERSINGFFEVGCGNGDTIARCDNSIIWVANDYTVRRLEGITPRRISTHAVEQFLSDTDVTSGRSYAYNIDGHFYYVLTFASGCWVYDATTNEWHERESYSLGYYRWQTTCAAHGRQLVGDVLSGTIGEFDPENYTENDSTQRMEWTYQPVYSENRSAVHRRLEVILEPGVGLVSGQGSDPEIMLDCSDDGGQTWRSFPNKKLGRIGEYTWRVVWDMLGSARQRVYRMAISDPVRVAVTQTTLIAEGARI